MNLNNLIYNKKFLYMPGVITDSDTTRTAGSQINIRLNQGNYAINLAESELLFKLTLPSTATPIKPRDLFIL